MPHEPPCVPRIVTDFAAYRVPRLIGLFIVVPRVQSMCLRERIFCNYLQNGLHCCVALTERVSVGRLFRGSPQASFCCCTRQMLFDSYPQLCFATLLQYATEPERIAELRDEHDHHTYLLHEVIGLRAVAGNSNLRPRPRG